MTPFAGFTYFGVAAYVVLPAVALGLAGRLTRHFVALATLVMLVVQYTGTLAATSEERHGEWAALAAYALFQWLLARVFLWLRPRSRRDWPVWIVVSLSLLPLAGVKLVGAYGEGLSPGDLGFLGISYVSFRAVDVLIGIQDGLVASVPWAQYLTYLFFFPTVSSGPIDRFRRFESDWSARRTRDEYLVDLDEGVHRVFKGLLYKFVLADLIKSHWLKVAAKAGGLDGDLFYMYVYSLYLFFDFAGYSALAVGVSRFFGVRTPENFDRPFLAWNIRDFWNRWHISLSWWFRDHVYMRFVLAARRGKWFADSQTASHLGFLLTMGLMGLWHGPAARYILYGLYHGVLLVGHDIFTRWNAKHRVLGNGALARVAAVLVTSHAVAFGFLLFSGRLL